MRLFRIRHFNLKIEATKVKGKNALSYPPKGVFYNLTKKNLL